MVDKPPPRTDAPPGELPPHTPTEPEIAKGAASAWWDTFFASPAKHRDNAQAGYAIAAAVATAITGAGLLTNLSETPKWVQIPFALALALWLFAAWKFMRTVAFQPDLGGVVHEQSQDVLARDAIQRTWRERQKIARRSWKAQRWAAAAGVMTFIALLVLMLRPTVEGDATQSLVVGLTTTGAGAVDPLCAIPAAKPVSPGKRDPHKPFDTPFAARADPDALDDAIVELKDVACPKTHGKITLRVPKAAIAGTTN